MSVGQLSYMLRTASTCARLCNALYGGRPDIVGFANQIGARFRYTTTGFASAAVIDFNGTAYVAICGTNDAHDWVQNLSARIDDSDSHPMHAGFKASASVIYDELIDDGAMKLIEGKRLVLCGHSSGGAMAAAMASPVVAPRFTASEVYTFGSPRVFSPTVAARYASAAFPTYRFVMRGDPVPCLPLRSFRLMFAGAKYAHTGTELRMSDDGTIETERPSCLTERFVKAFGIVGAYTILASRWCLWSILREKHCISRYCNALNEAIVRAEQ
jgi:hypothetical protein